MSLIRYCTFAIAALAVSAPSAHAQRNVADTAYTSMIAAERAFATAALRENPQNAFLAFLASDALLYRPRVVRAAAYLRARPMVDYLALTWEPVFADIAATGDLAWTTGPWISSDRRQPEVRPTFGQYVRIWRRQPDSRWKVELEAGIAHEADSIGPKRLVRASAASARRDGIDTVTEQRRLMQADSAFAKAAERDGAATAFRARASGQMRLLRRGRFPLTGAEAAAFLQAANGYTWRPVAARLARAGDIGYTYGVYAVTTGSGDARRAIETGDYLRIWRRSAAGEWQVMLDLTSPVQ